MALAHPCPLIIAHDLPSKSWCSLSPGSVSQDSSERVSSWEIGCDLEIDWAICLLILAVIVAVDLSSFKERLFFIRVFYDDIKLAILAKMAQRGI